MTKVKTFGHVICPDCGRPLPEPVVMPETAGERGLVLRTYFGWCFGCDHGVEVIQYKAFKCWVVAKWRGYAIDEAGQMTPWPEWTIEAMPSLVTHDNRKEMLVSVN